MKSKSYLLLAYAMSKQLKKKNVWQQANYLQKIKKVYLVYLWKKENEKKM